MGNTRLKTSAEKLTASERRARACELRVAGAPLKVIAQELGITIAGASKSIKTAIKHLDEKSENDASEYRRLQLERLDAMLLGQFDKAINGDTKAADCVVRIEKRRASLLGLDAPQKTDLTTNGKPMLPPGAIVIEKGTLEGLPDEILRRIRESLAVQAEPDDD